MYRKLTSIKKLRPTSTEVSEARFKRFLKDLGAYEQRVAFTQTLDSFLDLYSKWLKTQEQSLKLRIVMMAFELHRLDQAFQCDLSFGENGACEKSA